MTIAERRAALMERLRKYGGPINEPAVMAQFMAQVMHESGGLRYVREIWGPTAAQKRYEGRKDLGNTKAGDGKRFMGRDVLQITGRVNYRALTQWVQKTFAAKVNFETNPELLEGSEWLGIGAIWYFLAARPKLIQYCREGNIEMVTRLVNPFTSLYASNWSIGCTHGNTSPGLRDLRISAGYVAGGWLNVVRLKVWMHHHNSVSL